MKGVGENKAAALAKLGINTVSELLSYFPRRYEDRRKMSSISELVPGEYACVEVIAGTQPRLAHIRKGMDIVRLEVIDGRDAMTVTFFNQPYIRDALKVGESYIFYGKVGGKRGAPDMINPVIEKKNARGKLTGRIVPVYGLTSGISNGFMMGIVSNALDAVCDKITGILPREIEEKYSLMDAPRAYRNIHFPSGDAELENACARMSFEELFTLNCAIEGLKEKRMSRAGVSLEPYPAEEFFSMLPFTPTGAQRRAVEDAFNDMQGCCPMNRLVQGDVGSGKTVVAAACCWLAAKNGVQSAFMAPTEILAQQHYKTLLGMLSPFGISVILITGGMKKAEQRAADDACALGAADVIVGTHALISGKREYRNLGLVIADEQHRFGVQQRAGLSRKGDSPHVLVMSATPIPRTLALLIYGELDVSIIDELPPGRKPVRTFAVDEDMRVRINAFVRRLVGEGRQVFIICPMVEENEDGAADELKSVNEYTRKLKNEVFPELRILSVHGKMKNAEKRAVMDAFAAGEADILVSTTVVEVGVDVPNAALIIVENADRFGLSQLHQLRGRVGRGQHESYCVLFGGKSADSQQRLRVMCKTNDGFEIAKEDLRLRGPGDFLGDRQHGLPDMRASTIAANMDMINLAREAARGVRESDPGLTAPEHSELKARVQRMLQASSDTLN